MITFIPNIFNKEGKKRKEFSSVNEALEFIVNQMNKQDYALEESYKNLEEAHHKTYCVMETALRLLCDKLESHGIVIDPEGLLKQVRAEVDKLWPKAKKEVIEERAAREKAVEELIKSVEDNK